MASEPLAVLIDADNASPRIITGLLAEVASYGTAHVKRIYGFLRLVDLVQAFGILDIEREDDTSKVVMVRLTEAKA